MPESVQGFRWTDLVITLSAGVCTFVLYGVLVVTIVIQGLLAMQWAKLDVILTEAESIIQESEAAIDRLNSLGFDDCNTDTLLAMQQELFLSSRIRDIGFVTDNALRCTTGHGILKTPFKQQPWDFIGPAGFKYWPEVPMVLFGGEITAPLLGKGQFNTVIDIRWLKQQARPGDHLEIMFRDEPSNTRYAYGDTGVFRNLDSNTGQVISLSGIYSESCRNLPPYCVAVDTEYLPGIKRNLPLAILLLGIGLALGLAISRIVWQSLKDYRSTISRVIRGVKRKGYYPLYQPIVDLQSGKVVGCEVLARFQDQHGAICPDVFIPLLAKANLSWPFTELIIQKVLSDLEPSKHLPDDFMVHINLYPSDIASGKPQSAKIIKVLSQSRFQIAFEITEDEQLDTAAAQNCLKWIRQNGIELSVDDFGTGYSNLSKVRDLECSTLKIDRSFIFDIDAGGLGYALVPLMIQIGQELGMDIVTEGVETERQARIVKEMGSRYAQGWVFGKPMTAKCLEEHLQ
jgi:sensor c-di-GMP phosphodiesterase-like protein